MKATWINTPVGQMMVIADEDGLYLLEFVNPSGVKKNIERQIETLCHKMQREILLGTNKPIVQIERELNEYFAGKRLHFETPLHLLGSPFQKEVWNELLRISYGTTRSYVDLAKSINKPTAFRAVANANGANPLAIVIPCHRVIHHDGRLGGYGGGIERKKSLIDHEAKYRD